MTVNFSTGPKDDFSNESLGLMYRSGHVLNNRTPYLRITKNRKHQLVISNL